MDRGELLKIGNFTHQKRKTNSCKCKHTRTLNFTDPDTTAIKEPASLLISAEQLTRMDGTRESCEKKTGRERRREGTRSDDLALPHNA